MKNRRVVTDYSFILQGAGTSTASVTATQTTEVTWHTLLEFLPGLYVGPAGGGVEYSSDSNEDEADRCWESDEDCWEDDDGQKRVKSSIRERLVAKIDVTGAASASWQLSLDANRSGTLFDLEVRAGSLTDGNRQIAIAPSMVVERSDGRPTWAYRFVEGGTTMAVLEFGDRVQSVVWMRQELPDDTQLMLAAAMTAILQGQATTLVTHSINESLFLPDRVLVLTHRPGKIKMDMAADPPRPRKDDIRYTPHFGKLARKLREAIE